MKGEIKKYDVIIAGASFAGLAVASKIKKGNILLIDRHEIGSFQSSACGTSVKMVKDVGCEESILKTFDALTVHTKNTVTDISIPLQFCTIDYKKFCKKLAAQNNADFLKATIRGIKDSAVVTSGGDFNADIIVDCTGWDAVLAASVEKGYVDREMLSFGIETEVPYEDNKLRFFVDPDIIKNGAAWIFPCNGTARFGVGSYAGDTQILKNLEKFVSSYGLKTGELHGGFFCYCLKEPVIKSMFVVGCAAGQTLPLTGEGIRRSVYFGLRCGEIIQRVLDNKISLERGLEEYRKYALKGEKRYADLLKAQKKLPALANWELNAICKGLSIGPVAKKAWKIYEGI